MILTQSSHIYLLLHGGLVNYSSFFFLESQNIESGRVVCLVLSKKIFKELIGAQSELLQRKTAHETRERNKYISIKKNEKNNEQNNEDTVSPAGDQLDGGMVVDGADSAASSIGGSIDTIATSNMAGRHILLNDLYPIATLGIGYRSIIKLVQWRSNEQEEQEQQERGRGRGRGGTFALKMIPLKHLHTGGPSVMKRIVQEREILAQMTYSIKSPWIIKLYTTYFDDQNISFLFEYCPCSDVLTYLWSRKNRQIHEKIVRFIIAGVIFGLEHLHQSGIMHRDIKTENILINGHGYPKLCGTYLIIVLLVLLVLLEKLKSRRKKKMIFNFITDIDSKYYIVHLYSFKLKFFFFNIIKIIHTYFNTFFLFFLCNKHTQVLKMEKYHQDHGHPVVHLCSWHLN